MSKIQAASHYNNHEQNATTSRKMSQARQRRQPTKRLEHRSRSHLSKHIRRIERAVLIQSERAHVFVHGFLGGGARSFGGLLSRLS